MLTKAAGVWYDEFSNLTDDVPVHAFGDSSLRLPPDAAGTRWVDGLTVVHNWSWDEVSATPPGALSDVLADRAPVTGALTLGPWDVRVLVRQP